ncbi:hypothetical protein BRC99_00955 [Halobacteriales archaeon QS_7_69_60]|nr:MAG: hypothetical protein BRC99_00955 [Halobacteriales archaeon QS_7_69_60]
MRTESKRETTGPSEKWLDPGTRKGLLFGLLRTTIAAAIIALSGIGGFVVSAGSLVRYRGGTPPEWRTDLRWRTAIYAGVAVAFLVLFATLPATAVIAGLGYLVGRLVTHVVLYAAG